MSRTTKPLPRSEKGSELLLSNLNIGVCVVLEHNITGELMYGVVMNFSDTEDGCWLRRTDRHGNKLALMLIELDDDDYTIKEYGTDAVYRLH